MKFRKLRADEIDCRVQSIKKTGLILLLYKDARCDMNILDETVGAENWQRHHSRDNANCTVSIWDDTKKQWVEKEDTGTESNTEKEKGLASDSFKRACFNWGIGRELYTAPFLWIESGNYTLNERGQCNDRFKVERIGYDSNGCINDLVIRNEKLKRVVYPPSAKSNVAEDNMNRLVTPHEKQIFLDRCKQLHVDYRNVGKQVGATSLSTMTAEQHGKALIVLKDIEEMNGQ